MDRKSQILAPTTKVGGVRRPYKQATPKTASLKATLDTFRGEMSPTILETCSYRAGDSIVTYENANVQSITSKGRKHICFLITGKPTVMKESEVLDKAPKDVESVIRSLASEKNGAADSNLESEVPE